MKVQAASAAAALASVATAANIPRAQTASITPHEQYSSSIGVLGCHIDTNRVAYWPSPVDCDKICVKVSYQGRSVNLLKIDQSGGAFDISYDAWNYLGFGVGAEKEPHQGGGISMSWEDVPVSECASLMTPNGKLALSGANSMNTVDNCVRNHPDSFIAKNYELRNILDPVCKYGYDEVCHLENGNNQATCPHQLGSNNPSGIVVYNIQYGTGKKVAAA